MISFARGVPAPECLPVEELADCARAALERDGRTILSYGPSPGYAPLRDWIAERHGVDAGRVFITNGSLQGFVFLAQRLAAGKRVLVERPTYDQPLKILRELGANVVGLHCDEEGLDRCARARAADGDKPAFLYPSHVPESERPHMSEGGVRESSSGTRARPARTRGRPVRARPLRGQASSCSSSGGRPRTAELSKTIAPGIRVGWFVLPEALAREIELTATSTYITPVLLGQATVHEFLRRGNFESNLERVRSLIGMRRDAMLAALERELPNVRTTRPEGGYFLWAELDGVDAGELLTRAEEAGVTLGHRLRR
jgi:DNA-binding transcriptional MocR family regulator